MRPEIHPAYHKVLYLDTSTNDEWVGYSTLSTDERKVFEGEELPVVRLDISAKSHPFWTGQARTVDTEGRIDRFQRRYGRRKKKAKAADKPAEAKAEGESESKEA
jgi:large subunit ribosomal protein L31